MGLTPLLISGHELRSTTRSVTRLHLTNLENAAQVIGQTASAERRSEHLEAARRDILDAYSIDSSAADLPPDLHAEPWDIAAIWALDRTWNPPPVFQSYSAYTAELDRRNAEHFQSSEAPHAILQSNETIDGQVRTVGVASLTTGDHVLVRSGRPARGLPGAAAGQRSLRVVKGDRERSRVPRGVSVPVPEATTAAAIVAARFDYPVAPTQRLLSIVLKPTVLDEVGIDGTLHRFLTGTSENLHLLRVPSTVGDARPPQWRLVGRRAVLPRRCR